MDGNLSRRVLSVVMISDAFYVDCSDADNRLAVLISKLPLSSI